MRFYAKDEEHAANTFLFEQLVHDMDLDIVWPNKEARPWYVTFKVGVCGSRPQTISAWPHLLKAYWHRDGGPVHGFDDIVELVIRATDYAYEPAGIFSEGGSHAAPVS